MVVSCTKTKSSAGESCTPLGNLSPTIKTFTSFVTVSYSRRLKRNHFWVKMNIYASVFSFSGILSFLTCTTFKLRRQNSQETFVYEHKRNNKALETGRIHEGFGLNIMLTPSLLKQMLHASPLEGKRGISFILLQVSLATSTQFPHRSLRSAVFAKVGLQGEKMWRSRNSTPTTELTAS